MNIPYPDVETVMLVIQAIAPQGHFQAIHAMPDHGYMTVTHCYGVIEKFINMHPDWYFVYVGCIY
jgi:hypothetical protein